MITLSWSLRLSLSLVFAVAAATKFRTRAAFTEFVESLAGFGVPIRLRATVGFGFAGSELACAALLHLPGREFVGCVVAIVLLFALSVGVYRAVSADTSAICNCFGSGRAMTRLHVVRNVGLTAVAVLALVATISTPNSWPNAPGITVGSAAGLALAAVSVYLDDIAYVFRPVDPFGNRTNNEMGAP